MFKKMTLVSLCIASSLYAANVLTWVPNYSIPESEDMLNQDFGGVGMKDGLTHLALQFWQPKADGSIYYSNNGGTPAKDTDVSWFKTWGAANNVKVLLCVYNPVTVGTGFDWPPVQTIIASSTLRTTLINNLFNEMNRHGLDGIEVDLEGAQQTSTTDRTNFMLFMNELSAKVKGAGKILSISTFASNWHTPGTGLWSQLLPITDMVTSMGYEETGILGDASTFLNYSGQKSKAGTNFAKLNLGMPGSMDSWLSNPASQQVAWAVSNGTGVAIWDATLSASAWQTAGVWNQLKTIKQGAALSSSSVASSSSAVISSSVKVSSSSANSPVFGSAKGLALVSSNGSVLQVQGQGAVQMSLLNLQGQRTWSGVQNVDGHAQVDMGEQKSGVYFLELRQGAAVQRVQLILR